MQHDNPCIAPYNAPDTPTPASNKAARRGKTALLARLLRAGRHAILGNPRIRQVPIGHPEARTHRPGERRIVFGHNVLIIRDQTEA